MKIPTVYDQAIERAAAQFLPFLDWHWLKAQLWCESRLNPSAVSWIGAEGIGQIMPGTWPEIREGLGLPDDASPFTDVYGIAGAAWYDRQMWNKWRSPRPELDRIKLMFASYNAGFGNVLKAQGLAHGATGAEPVLAELIHVTGAVNAKETRDYVRRIIATRDVLLKGEST
jgi:membrane-bound lytic murein transglycosylase F